MTAKQFLDWGGGANAELPIGGGELAGARTLGINIFNFRHRGEGGAGGAIVPSFCGKNI